MDEKRALPQALGLEPHDWYWATWRDLPPLERPAAQPFDLAQCVERLSGIGTGKDRSAWDWMSAGMTPALSPQEATVWLAAMQRAATTTTTTLPDVAAQLWRERFDRMPDADAVLKVVMSVPVSPALMLPLANLLPIVDVIDVLFAVERHDSARRAWQLPALALLDGFRVHALPYLTPRELAAARERARRELGRSRWPRRPRRYSYDAPPLAFHLAACLGLHDAILSLVESWPDTRYARGDRSEYWLRPQDIIFGLGDPRLVKTHMRRLGLTLTRPAHVRAWLAHTEAAALDLVYDSIMARTDKDGANALLDTFARVDIPEAAPHMLRLMIFSRTPRPARAWLEAHPTETITGLVPVAAGNGRLAIEAAGYLRSLARRGHDEAVRAAFGHVDLTMPDGPHVTLSIPEQPISLDDESTLDPLRDACSPATSKRTGKRPSWLHIGDLPPIVVESHCLDDARVEAVLLALRQSTLDAPHTLLVTLRRHADRATLDAFAWSLFTFWLAEGAPPKELWMLTALGLLSGDASALKLANLIRVWPRDGQSRRAALGLRCLRAIGSDAALRALYGIAREVTFKGLKRRAWDCMEECARDRGLTLPALEDRFIPACGLDAHGSRAFDLGNRRLHAVIGPGLRPMLRAEDGAVRRILSRPRATDDPALATRAIEQWKAFKEQVATVVDEQSRRLEGAMFADRRWPLEELKTILLRHPVMGQMVRLLVWGVYDASGALVASFRIAEDGAYADSLDETLTFPAGKRVTVGVVQPDHLPDEERQTWITLLCDYGIIPPFPQLSRAERVERRGRPWEWAA